MSRSFIYCLAAIALAAVGCNEDDNDGTTSYCDSTGCYACTDHSHKSCWALPHPTCSTSSDCAHGAVCTSVGCCSLCHSDGDCRKGEYCTSQSYCAPRDVNAQPTDTGSSQSKNPTCLADAHCPSGQVCNAGLCAPACKANLDCSKGLVCAAGKCKQPGAPACGVLTVALCAGDADCGAGRVCNAGNCHAACTSSAKCPLGQACTSGVCLDAAPAKAQCVWDADCGPASRCINAACHPLCGQSAQCATGEFCDSGVCRADYRPAR